MAKDITELLKDLDDNIQDYQEKLEKLIQARQILTSTSLKSNTSAKVNTEVLQESPEYIGYPKYDVFEKMNYILNDRNRVLKFSQIETAFIQFENNSPACQKLIAKLRQIINRVVDNGRMFKVKFGNNKRLTYYGINRDWLLTDDDNKLTLSREFFPPDEEFELIESKEEIEITDNYSKNE